MPLQSVHAGKRFVHEPLRLNVVIQAPEAAMDAVLATNANVRALVENGWLHLHALHADGRIRRFEALGEWRDVVSAGRPAGPTAFAPAPSPGTHALGETPMFAIDKAQSLG